MTSCLAPTAAKFEANEWRKTWHVLQDDKVVTPILRLSDYGLMPDELRLFHAEDFREDACFDLHLDILPGSCPSHPRSASCSPPRGFRPTIWRGTTVCPPLREALRADFDRLAIIAGVSARAGVDGMGGIGK